MRPEDPDRKEKIEQIKETYMTEEVKSFVFKLFEALGIDTTNLEFAVEYESSRKSPDRIKVGARLLEDMELDVG